MLAAHGITHVGLVRKANEDALFWDVDRGVFIVADGMGGHSAGEVASQLAVETVRGFIARALEEGQDSTWPYGYDMNVSLNCNRLLTAMKLANARIYKASAAREAYNGMGTTTVAALVEHENATFSSVGDSRIYSFRDGHLQQLTRDDSWAAEVLAREPGMTPEAIANNRMRHVLTNVVGAREQTQVEVSSRDLTDGEMLMFCSDGLHGMVDDPTIEAIMAGSTDLAEIAAALVERALQQGGRDNVTALVLRYTARGA
jgi:serine/threonine protein phosphatase PrpC